MASLDPNTTNPSLFPRAWKQEFSVIAQHIANTGNALCHSTPSLTTEKKHQVNETFKNHAYNPARLPDELILATVQQAGSLLHALSEMADTDFLPAVAIAPTARSIIEQSALISALTDNDDHALRVAKSARALKEAIAEEKKTFDNPFVDELHRQMSTFVQTYTSTHRGRKISISEKASNLIDEQFPGIDGKQLYHELCGYTHHNSFISYYMLLQTINDSTAVEMKALYFCICAAQTFTSCLSNIPKFHIPQEADIMVAELDYYAERLRLLSNRIALFDQQLGHMRNSEQKE